MRTALPERKGILGLRRSVLGVLFHARTHAHRDMHKKPISGFTLFPLVRRRRCLCLRPPPPPHPSTSAAWFSSPLGAQRVVRPGKNGVVAFSGGPFHILVVITDHLFKFVVVFSAHASVLAMSAPLWEREGMVMQASVLHR